jgi:tetratricopeptide (TPR) repeat protein
MIRIYTPNAALSTATGRLTARGSRQKRMKSYRKPISIACAFSLIISCVLISGAALNKNAIAYNKEGYDHLKRENYRKAIFSFKNALTLNPKYKDALIGLGKAYLEVEAFDQSIDLFTAALAIDKQSVESMVSLGKTLAAMGNYTGALKYFSAAQKLSAQDLDARYGRAYVYYNLGKKIWAQRTLGTVLAIDPYHYDSLLLKAEIKSSDNRLKEARKYVEKAIDSRNESSKGHVVYGDILLRDFMITENRDRLIEAKEALANAISIQPESFQANRAMGYISLMEKNYDQAAAYFRTALGDLDSSTIRYGLAVASDRAGNIETALEEFRKALKKDPSDSILRNRFEDFLIFRDFKIGHPERVRLNKENFDLATSRMKKNFPDQAIMYLRRSLQLNPLSIGARELLMEYYNSQGFNGFYLDEMKEILRLNPDKGLQEKLGVAIIKRRDLLYHREGYSAEAPARDVPSLLVLNFDPMGTIGPHPDAGEVIANQITFVLGQFGRTSPIGLRMRSLLNCFPCGSGHLDSTLDSIESKSKAGELTPVDYILYGAYYENGGYISLECRLMDLKKGIVIGQFTITESGKENLPQLSLRAAKRIYAMIPYKGRVLKMKESGIIANLGLFDGLGSGSKLVIYKSGTDKASGDKLKKKIIFTVKEADTLISYAEPLRSSDIDSVEQNDTIYPLKQRRAKRIE